MVQASLRTHPRKRRSARPMIFASFITFGKAPPRSNQARDARIETEFSAETSSLTLAISSQKVNVRGA